MAEPADLLIHGGVVIPMDASRSSISEGAVVTRGDRIVAVTSLIDARARFTADLEIGGSDTVVIPGLINAHQHLTGDRLIRSTIPDDVPPGSPITDWALPSHAAHTADDDELSATLSLIEAVSNGVTFTVEAGTVGHPARVLAAFERVGVGGTLGSWGWDVGDGPWAASLDDVVARQTEVLTLTRDHPTVHGWITLVGHDLMTDALVVAASELARVTRTGLTFHLSPSTADVVAYKRRTGQRPVRHLAALGALGNHVLIAHAVHIDDSEVDLLLDHDVAVAVVPVGIPAARPRCHRIVQAPEPAPARRPRRHRVRQRERRRRDRRVPGGALVRRAGEGHDR